MSGETRITRSNYTIKKKHKSLSNGTTIYERDFMTTSNWGAFDGGTFPLGEYNFKMVTRDANAKQRKHKYGKWIKPEDSESEYWTSKDIEETVLSTTENNIVLKPNNNSLLEFAYYGSCTEMIKSSIRNIIGNYPGELYVTDKSYLFNGSPIGSESFLDLVIVSNPFNIDITSDGIPSDESAVNKMRHFSLSAGNYGLYSDEEEYICCTCDWYVTHIKKNCFNDGDLVDKIYLCTVDDKDVFAYNYYINGSFVLFMESKYTGYHIRPMILGKGKISIEEALNRYFPDMDDFEAFLLNTKSEPVFSVVLDFPHETEEGIATYKKRFTWPILNGWNIAVSGDGYETYINGLMELSSFYDEYYTDNLWRMITHDAIKNLDKTFELDNIDEDDIQTGVGRMEGFLLPCARFFDDIKRYTDGIKHINTITYNQNSNLPDYFFSDNLELKGWEVYDTTSTLDKSTTVSDLYEGSAEVFNTSNVNVRFMQNLILNSNAILSRKGTEYGMEMILGMFGMRSYNDARNRIKYKYKYTDTETGKENTTYDFHDIPYNETIDEHGNHRRKRASYTKEAVDEIPKSFYDYRIDEYVYVAQNTSGDVIPYETEEKINYLPAERYNTLKKNYADSSDYADIEDDTIQGLPVRIVYIEKNEEIYKYLIPWVSDLTEVDGEPYFQMYGGWDKHNLLKNEEVSLGKNTSVLISNSRYNLYGETLKYLHVAKNVTELSSYISSELYDGIIFYVYDLSDYKDCYGSEPLSGTSNYFVLQSKNYCKEYDSLAEDGERPYSGWANIPLADIEKGENDGMQVLNLESIIDEGRGNNPHVGYGAYDDGETYIDYLRQLFKYSIENNNFTDDAYDCETGELLSGITNVGFDMVLQKDNAKCWYFTDHLSKETAPSRLIETNDEGVSFGAYKYYPSNSAKVSEYNGHYDINHGYESGYTPEVQIGENANGHYESELNAFNLETQEEGSNDEAASYSVINTKRMKITFSGNLANNSDFKKYYEACIKPYLLQVIPSTTIFEVEIEKEDASYVGIDVMPMVGVSES